MQTRRQLLAAAAALPWVAAQANAPYPSKNLRIITGFAAGGSSDAVIRTLGTAMSTRLGVPVTVDNRGGASGLLGLDAVSNAPADGSVIGMLANTTTAALYQSGKDLNVGKRFLPIGRFVESYLLFVVNPKVIDVRNLQGLLAYFKAHPGTPLATAGTGGLGHLTMLMLEQRNGLSLSPVAYRGLAPALADVLSGQVGGMFIEANLALQYLRTGQLRAVFAASSKRVAALPDLATAKEQGHDYIRLDSNIGLIAPPGVPAAVIATLEQALQSSLQDSHYKAFIQKTGDTTVFDGAKAYASWLQMDFDYWARVIDAAGLRQPR